MTDYKKILIVDDSAFMRKIIGDFLQNETWCQVVGTARNGKEGLKKIQELKPDLVLLDIEMPVMNGLEMLEKLMKTNPIPVIIISTLATEGTETTIRALELGAVDFITKPTNIFKMNQSDIKEAIIQKIRMASSVTSTHLQRLELPGKTNIKALSTEFNQPSSISKIQSFVAIGVSTGGPRALQQVLPLIPEDIGASFLIVQHMPPGFTKSLSDRLNQMSQIHVKEAEDGEVLAPGVAYIAPGDYHMLVEQKSSSSSQYVIRLSMSEPVGRHRPSVDVMMESIAKLPIKNAIGVIMTGMGSDGTVGMIQLKEKLDAFTIAQDETSCVVYGMPKAAVEAGVVDEVVSLEKIAERIIKQLGV